MKQRISLMFVLVLFCSLLFATSAYAIGEGNVDSGGGGMGQGSKQNYWSSGNEGIRVTIVRSSDHVVVSTPIDLSNKAIGGKIYHFGKVSKLQYTNGAKLSPINGGYVCVKPSQSLPKVIRSNGSSNIASIKSYFTDEQVIRSIANLTGMQFDVLINGEYRLMIEPIAYYTFQGIMIGSTATEAAMYDEQLNGGLRRKMVSLTHKNLPLAMFLETADLGYPAWGGSKSAAASNTDIKSSLGLGIVRFHEMPPEAPEAGTYDYEYRTSTEVITTVNVSGGQSDPDHPVSVVFNVGGRNYTVNNVYYPDGDSQLAWIRWTTPDTPQKMTITVDVQGGGSVSQNTIHVILLDLDENPPPDPDADDRNDSYTRPAIPDKVQVTMASWGVWRPWWQAHWVWHSDERWIEDRCDGFCPAGCAGGHGHWEDMGYWCDEGWWEFTLDNYNASLTGSMNITPDEKAPTASGKRMKSGYGINEKVTTHVSTNQSSAVTAAQNAVTYFPEFQYQDFWRLLERMGGGYDMVHEFKENRYSTYNRRTHFVPIWFPDGNYIPYTWLIDCWTPAGMLSMNLTDSIMIEGNVWDDWHIAPQKPD